MAEIAFTREYLEMIARYEKTFGREFDGYMYDTDESIEIMKKCVETGKPYDLASDPNFDPEADY